ncbi:hypothetical protein [Salibacterium salarium]|uniref:hypothetical protein n=1 Tax=Salibacterium salarium TaxID=284579 RepID=UPI003D7E45DC
MVGIGGSIIKYPMLLYISPLLGFSALKIPTRMAIATSLGITFISSIGATVGKISTGQVLLSCSFQLS